MARVYKRPLAFFFLDERPAGTNLPPDFRLRTVGGQPPVMSRDLIVAIRQAKNWQNTVGRLAAADPEIVETTELPFARIADDAEEVAGTLRDFLGISTRAQRRWSSHEAALAAWRSSIESQGVLVFSLNLSRDIARGFSLNANGGPPVIALARESDQARTFTLLHELAHLTIRTAAICSEFEDNSSRGTTERFCNRVAANALLPEEMLTGAINRVLGERPLEWTTDTLLELSQHLHVSAPATALRLETLGLAEDGLYEQWMRRDVPPFVRESRGGGGGNSWPGVRLAERGEAFSKAVYRAWQEGLMSTGDAAHAMSMKPKYVSAIDESLSRRRTRLGY
jgi:Zn-dependent peptidase ImmA (M78 family)